MDYIVRVEKECAVIRITPIIVYFNVVNELKTLANLEKENYNSESRMFHNFISEQIILCNTPYQKRVHPNESFAMACGLQLHSMSSVSYEGLRNK